MPESRFKLCSPVFHLLEPIPERYTAMDANLSPPLRWSGAPKETVELALICEDPDAPMPEAFVHWIIYGIPASVSYLPEGLLPVAELELPVLCRQGRNSLLETGYTGPNPPFWHASHHYIFKLYALNKPIELWSGAGRSDFYKAIENKILAEARLVGIYSKTPLQKARAAMTWVAAGAAAWGTWKAIDYGRKRLSA